MTRRWRRLYSAFMKTQQFQQSYRRKTAINNNWWVGKFFLFLSFLTNRRKHENWENINIIAQKLLTADFCKSRLAYVHEIFDVLLSAMRDYNDSKHHKNLRAFLRTAKNTSETSSSVMNFWAWIAILNLVHCEKYVNISKQSDEFVTWFCSVT